MFNEPLPEMGPVNPNRPASRKAALPGFLPRNVGRNDKCGCGSLKKYKNCCRPLFDTIAQDIKSGAHYVACKKWPFLMKVQNAAKC